MLAVSFPDLAPSVCIVCEGVPPETSFVDTLRTFDTHSPTHLSGRKYLCEVCVTTSAEALDLFEAVVLPHQARILEQDAEIARMKEDIQSFADIRAAVESLKRPVVTPELVADASVTAVEKKKARAAAAKAAQDAINDAQAAADAGAAQQIVDEQVAADKQQAASVAALAAKPTVAIEHVIPPAEPSPVDES